MPENKILIVDDEEAIRDLLADILTASGYETIQAGEAASAYELAYETQPDLILLDWMLPGGTGLEVMRKLKREELTSRIPVIMVTAKSNESSIIQGLESGADDYISKPFSPAELRARVTALLRRSQGQRNEDLQAGKLRLLENEKRAVIGDHYIELGPTEYKLLEFFMRHPNQVFSRNQLIDRIWGSSVYIEERTIDVNIRRLRKALEAASDDTHNYGHNIETRRAVGYLFNKQCDKPAVTPDDTRESE